MANVEHTFQFSPAARTPHRVVGVVGIGHQKGIQDHWGKLTQNDVFNLLV